MAITRTRTLRDAVLILVGATCMHLASSFLGTVTDHFSGDIIVNTHFNSPEALSGQLADAGDLSPAALKANVDDLSHNHDHLYLQDPPLLPPVPTHTRPDVSYDFPETTLDSHVPGWSMFSNLYMSNGTLYIVTNSPPSSFPDIKFITSTGLVALNTPENIAARMPTSANMDFITPEQARDRWGPLEPDAKNRVWSVEGNTFLFNDPSQFLDHYYHFCAELLFGAWAFWSGAHNAHVDPASAHLTTAPQVDRAIFAHADAKGWRDKPGFNSYFLRAAFPSLTVEVQSDWEDRIASTAGTGWRARAWHFDKVMFSDRSAAFRGEVCGAQVHRTAGESVHHMYRIGNLTKLWWEPVRRGVLRFAGVDDETLDIGVRVEEGALSRVKKPLAGLVGAGGVGVGGKGSGGEVAKRQDIVVTYISRQGARRHLIEEHHDALASALEEMCNAHGWELNIVMAERLTKDEQAELMARTTVSVFSLKQPGGEVVVVFC